MNDSTSLPDHKVIQCNYRVGTSDCASGARAYLTHDGDCERAKILARSRSGRWILHWEAIKRLHNFRLKTLCSDDPLYAKKKLIALDHWSQEVVDNLNSLAAEWDDTSE
jgi:hypothetical protein